MPRLSSLLTDISPLRESPAYRRLWAGSTLSAVGSALTMFAVTLQVYRLTHSPLAVGLIGLAQMVPLLLIGLLAGSLADAVDRRRLVLVTTIGLAAMSVALAAQAFAGLRQLWLLYAITVVQASLSAVNQPARRTFIPALLPPRLLPAGLALNRVTFQVMMIAGPALAGLITAVPALGLRFCYLIDAVSFTAAIYGVARLPVLRAADSLTRPGLRAVAEGVSFIRRTPVLAGAFLADLSATVFGLPSSLFPAINAERFGGDPRTLGLFATAVGVGGLASAVLSGPVSRVSRQGLAMLVAVAVWGGAFAGFAVAPGLALTLALLAVAGCADTVTVVLRGIIVQTAAPDRLRGRITAADFVVGAGGGQLGNLEAGALGSLTTPVISALAGGLVTIAAVVIIGVRLPAFSRFRAQPHPAAPGTEPGTDGPGAAEHGTAEPGAAADATPAAT
ncbi:MAG TPA: MFS transporter [Streptosporangiaceae bacterium]